MASTLDGGELEIVFLFFSLRNNETCNSLSL